MASKKYDLVIFGASGFTGQFVIDHVAKLAEEEKLTWAVAGRTKPKLLKALSEASIRTGKKLSGIPMIIADTGNHISLDEMAKQARVVLNCVGPYRFFGEPVVKACIENGAHHLDISGEPQFLETMQFLYDKKAKENNVMIIGATGFDSVPAESGIMQLLEKFQGGALTNVESFLSIQHGPKGGGINFATYESAVHSFQHAGELIKLRKSISAEPMPKIQHRLPKRPYMFFSEEVKKWCLPFMGSDKSVVNRTVRGHFASGVVKNNVEFNPYLSLSSLCSTLKFRAFIFIFTFLCHYSLGRWLLLKFPQVFSLGYFKRGGPSQEQINGTIFTKTFVGRGFDSHESAKSGGKPNRQVTVRLTAPEPGYISTPICMVQCAAVVLREADRMRHTSGVLTPGAAFYGTSLLQRLHKHNVQFETISDIKIY
ncbi:saccharopine dehydrogenase-like oxidoreductase [Elysia marginata]|uniref:Saccharopine dehydrogenase-like oxidoreductase n=1 Tax=Elysia marginata TaxID=1093978 RepID=A0AAV4IYT6_9GAST|nr:saccharopine dehydrogenase-like oxidoreductase [Elysia marginata]